MEFGIDFYRDAPIDEAFVHGLFYRLIAEGARYNTENYPGKFFIITEDPADEVIETEDEIGEKTHKLADIVTKYCSSDTKKSSLAVYFKYVGESEFFLNVTIRPRAGASIVGIQTNTNEIETDEEFVEFVTLCKSVVESFDFVHCRYTNEHRDGLEFDPEAFVETPAEIITYYSDEIVDKIGREKLLSAPVRSAEEMDSGIFIVACIDRTGACERVNDLREYLGQETYF